MKLFPSSHAIWFYETNASTEFPSEFWKMNESKKHKPFAA